MIVIIIIIIIIITSSGLFDTTEDNLLANPPSHAPNKKNSTRAHHIPHYSGTAVSYLVPEMHNIALTVILNGPFFFI